MDNEPQTDGAENDAGWCLVVDPNSDGLRLDRFISTRIERLSRARAARLDVVDLDKVDLILKKSSVVRAGQRLWVKRPVPDADATPPEPTIIYEDHDILILNKPPGLAVHPTATRFKTTVTWWISQKFPGAGIEPVHRIDVETSGLLVCSKTPDVNRTLKSAFASGQVEKRYLAVVKGHPSQDSWTIDTPLGFHQDSAVRLRMGSGQLPAETQFRVIETLNNSALIEAQPITGRQHQIRVHLSMGGLPIIGDKIYGPDENLFLAHLERDLTENEYLILGHHRLALHASNIGFILEGRRLNFDAPLAPDLSYLAEK